MKILIVDDETISRTKLAAILEAFGEIRAVDSGVEAVREFQQALVDNAPFDLITMDINMPGMDGTEALFEIRSLEQGEFKDSIKRTRVIMVTAQSDRDSLITCVQAGCDDYIIKPFAPDKVIQRLKALKLPGVDQWEKRKQEQSSASRALGYKAGDKLAIGREVLTLFKRGELCLPSPPTIYRQFRKLIDQGAGLHEIADLLKDDLGVSFHLISISNSPYYRGVQENKNLLQAVSRLGLDLTRKYVDLLGNRTVFTTGNQAYQPLMENLWAHSVACANAAEILARTLNLTPDHDPFTMGIMHDVGKMVLIQVVSELEAQGKLARDVNRQDVLKTLDAYHGPFGEAVLRQWKFPADFSKVAKLHDKPDEIDKMSDTLALIQLANLISKVMGYGNVKLSGVDLTDAPSARRFGLKAETLEEVQAKLAEVMEETQKSMDAK